MQMALSLVSALGVGWYYGADVSFFLIDGLILVIAVTFVYIMANIGVFMFYRGEHRSEFNWLLHFVFPFVSSWVLIFAIWFTFFPPAGYGTPPGSPYNLAPIIDVIWFALGVAILLWMRARGREEWLLNAGDAIGEA